MLLRNSNTSNDYCVVVTKHIVHRTNSSSRVLTRDCLPTGVAPLAGVVLSKRTLYT